MSLINQMLHDLEQRRTADVISSPLRGISASASAIQPVGVSINYVALAAMVAVVFTGGVIG
ncbi:MAG: hypothetical protein GXP18_03480 [Gammaproteobacteria bacterium]|nr:hypothetical protein [Gammaproteobacteria bacterium]